MALVESALRLGYKASFIWGSEEGTERVYDRFPGKSLVIYSPDGEYQEYILNSRSANVCDTIHVVYILKEVR